MLQDICRINTQPLLKNIRMKMREQIAISELMRKAVLNKNHFKRLMKSTNAMRVSAQEIVSQGRPFTDGDDIKESFIKISEDLLSDFKKRVKLYRKSKISLYVSRYVSLSLSLSKDCQIQP